MTQIEIRLADARDAAWIQAILAEVFAEYRASYTDGGFDATVLSGAEIGQRMGEGPVWVATLDGTIVGTVAAVSKSDDLYIRGMAIVPKGRGHKIGQRLLGEIEKYARANGHRRLTLSTTPLLHRAIRLYESAGFLRTEEGDHELFGTPLFTMEKNLYS
ncbi:MAG TPA: GNAT family N-acetyltransferase [Bryobacteraceae bacterium]|nr:GNAT family N-acetyltransferase [Bryobacteraceae bacterium]